MTVSVRRLSVYVCPRAYLRKYTSDLYRLRARLAQTLMSTYGRGSVLLWRRRDTSCTRSGFMNDVDVAYKP